MLFQKKLSEGNSYMDVDSGRQDQGLKAAKERQSQIARARATFVKIDLPNELQKTMEQQPQQALPLSGGTTYGAATLSSVWRSNQ